MSVFLESLQPRFYWAVVDSTFGTKGTFTAADSVETTIVLATREAVFVGVAPYDELNFSTGDHLIRRLSPAGIPDTAWARGGSVAVPFAAKFMTYDAWRGKLIVVGPDDDQLQILRLNADGTRDNTFGDHGLLAYTSASTADEITLRAESATVLRDGGLLLGVTVTSRDTDGETFEDGSFFNAAEGPIETDLVRLRPGGTRNPLFGHRGVKVIASGSSHYFNDYDDITDSSDRYSVAAVVPLADGGFTVAMTRRQRDSGSVYGDVHVIAGVVSRTIDAHGAFASTPADGEWTLHEAKWDDDHYLPNDFTAVGVVPGPAGLTAFGNTQQGGALAFELSAGHAVVTHKLKLPEFSPTSVKRVRNGYIVQSIANYSLGRSAVARLTESLKPRTTWGNNGVLRFDYDSTVSQTGVPVRLALDADNRVLTYLGSTIRRYVP